MLNSRNSTDCWERADVGHIAFAIREFFHAIYVIYPTNFISYLRSIWKPKKVRNVKVRPGRRFSFFRNHFVDRGEVSSSQDVATYVICPLLASVRLHPNLVLVGKDKELSRNRWHQRESHDFLDDSRRVVIGRIPIRATSDNCDVEYEQQESPPPAPRDILAHLFPPSTSRNSHKKQNSGVERSCPDAFNPLSCNLPLHSQNRNAVDKEWAPLVTAGEEKVDLTS
ncbi:hypothetical protein OSTOST_00064 [Ostertagia ostertagi]